MISLRRIFFASVTAPLVIALPILVVAIASVKYVYPKVRAGEPVPLEEVIQAAVFSAGPVYLALVVIAVVSSLALRHFGYLSRKALLLEGYVGSLALAGLISCDWSESCEANQLAVNLPLFFCILAGSCTALVFAWWRVASNPSIERTLPGKPVSASHVKR